MIRSISFICFLIVFLCNAPTNAQSLHLIYQWKDSSIVGSNSFNNAYNEIWGTVQQGKEYAIIGSTFGLHIFDVSNPNQIYLATEIPTSSQGPLVVNRDFHEYGNYLYIVADQGPATLQIADLSFLPDSAPIIYDSNNLFSRGHTIFVDSANAILYVCGGNNQLNLYSLANPENPSLLLNCAIDIPGWNTIGYVHDIFVRNNIAFCNAGFNGLFIVDFSNLNDVKVLGSLTNYGEQGYNHSGRIHSNNSTYVFTDESHNTGVKVLDIRNFSNLRIESIIRTETHPEFTIAHDVSIREDILFISYYYDGIQVYDISDPKNPEFVSSYATTFLPHRNSFEGCWGIYAMLPSGLVLASDMQEGLFVFDASEIVGFESENLKSKTFEIFPNPHQDVLFIRGIEEKTNLKIFDLKGVLILEQEINNQEFSLNTASLPKGVYIASISSNSKKSTHKIIKN